MFSELYTHSKVSLLALIITAFLGYGCSVPGLSPSASLLNKVPINSVKVKVVDQNDEPIKGAQVEASNGRKTTTDADGMAKLKFGTVGIHNVGVYADNFMPNNTVITMPADNGTTVTARLTTEVQLGAMTFGMNMSANLYPMMFRYLFTGYGYQLELEDYPQGGWTEWASNDSEDTHMRKAFLKELDNGQQWWQIVIISTEKKKKEEYIAEILFSADRSSIVRMREKIGDNEPQEKPVSEGWYTDPKKLTKESIEGAVAERNVSVKVPADTFTADKLNFGAAPGMAMIMWRVSGDNVPGGIVKYKYEEKDSDDGSVMELTAYGTDAKSRLDSF